MSRNIVETFAAAYPSRSKESNQKASFDDPSYSSRHSYPSPPSSSYNNKPMNPSPGQIRTRLSDVVNNSYPPLLGNSLPIKEKFSAESGTTIKKFLAILLIVFLAAFIYSSFTYTLSDAIGRKFGMELFNEDGHPTLVIIVIHSLVFLGLVYLILNAIKWC